MAWDGQPDRLVPSEPVLIGDCFITGVTSVTYLGGLVRVVLHCDRPDETGEIERMIVCRLVMTEADFQLAAGIGFEAAQSHKSFPKGEARASH